MGKESTGEIDDEENWDESMAGCETVFWYSGLYSYMVSFGEKNKRGVLPLCHFVWTALSRLRTHKGCALSFSGQPERSILYESGHLSLGFVSSIYNSSPICFGKAVKTCFVFCSSHFHTYDNQIFLGDVSVLSQQTALCIYRRKYYGGYNTRIYGFGQKL